MTFKEKWMRDHPGQEFNPRRSCPASHGYEPDVACPNPPKTEADEHRLCGECWNREIPGTENKPTIKQRATCKERFEQQYPAFARFLRRLDTEGICCPHMFGYMDAPGDGCRERTTCAECWDKEITPFACASDAPHILDSGERRQFETGAVRDVTEGKGRPDLMPLRVLAYIWRTIDPDYASKGVDKARVFEWIADFMDTGDAKNLIFAVNSFTGYLDWPTAFLEVAKHFEEGAKKYGENNWHKGLPVNCYINSAVRHYLKWLRGDTDEPHDRAFVWNLLCCIWEVDFSPRAKMKGTPIAEELPDPEANSGRFYICNRTPCETCHSDCHCTEYRGEAAVLELCDRDVRYDECPVGLFMTDADGVFLKTEIINAETGLNTAVHIGLGLSRKFEADTVVTPIKYPFKKRGA